MSDDVLSRLAAVIAQRRTETASKSYTRELIDAGPERCARKLGEEAVETVIAAVGQDGRALTREAAEPGLPPPRPARGEARALARRVGRAANPHGHIRPCREGRQGED